MGCFILLLLCLTEMQGRERSVGLFFQHCYKAYGLWFDTAFWSAIFLFWHLELYQ